MKRPVIAPHRFLALPGCGPRSCPLALARTARLTPCPRAPRTTAGPPRSPAGPCAPVSCRRRGACAGWSARSCALPLSSLPLHRAWQAAQLVKPAACTASALIALKPCPAASSLPLFAAAVNVRAVATGADKPSKDALQDVASDASAALQAKGQELLTYAQVRRQGWLGRDRLVPTRSVAVGD